MHSKKRHTWRGVVAAVASCTVLVLSACTGAGGSPPASSAPKDGGSITMMSAGAVTSWDPLYTFGTLPGVITDRLIAVYGQLVYVDQQGKTVPSLAKSFSTDNGGATWTLVLRPGITFTDGTAYDAAAVKANWDRAASPDHPSAALALAQSFATEVVDGLTLRITPKAKNPVLDQQIAEQLQLIASPTALKKATYDKPVGAGPFVLTKADPALGEDLTARTDYALGRPKYDQLHFRVVDDPAQRAKTIASGDAQYMNGFASDFRAYENDPSYTFYSVPNGGFRPMEFNNQKAPFNDVRARKAVALALDPTELVQTMLADPSLKGSTTLFGTDSAYYEASLGLPQQNLQEAQRLVDELTAAGVKMDITIVPAAIPELIRAAEYVQAQLSKLKGVHVSVKQVSIQDIRTQTWGPGDYDITFYPGIYDVNPVATALTNFFGTGGSDNFQKSTSPEMEAALEKLRAATDDAARAEAARTIQQLYVDTVPVYVFGYDHRIFFHGSGIDGWDAVGRGALLPEKLYYTQ